MNGDFQVSATRIALTVLAILFEIGLPITLAIIARRKLGVGWRYFGFGALIFFLFQMITRVPLMTFAQSLIAPQLQSSRALLYGWLVVASLTAGLFEEIGRYVGYRWLMRGEEKTWNKAVMYGLGHGGLESMLLVAGLTAIGLINLIVLPTIPLNTLPEAQQAQVGQQLAAVAAQPEWVPLLGAWERLWTIPIHVALSTIVLQVFRRGDIRWLWLAVLAHTAVNVAGTMTLQLLGGQSTAGLLATEAVIALLGVAALGVAWRLRDTPAQDPPEPAELTSQAQI